MAFKPSLRKKREAESTELNLLPVMNLIIVLIPMLLSVAKLTEMALLEYLPPAEAAEGVGAAPEEGGGGGGEKANLNLLVNLAETGLQVSMFGKVEPGPYFFEIPLKPNGEYDFETLNARLWEIKQREVGAPIGVDSLVNEKTGKFDVFPVYKYQDGREISITALGKTPFQTIVNAMDACRIRLVDGEKQELFPITLLKQFQ